MSAAKKSPPPWLDTSQPLSDRARIQQCARCRRPILRALVGNPAGLDVRADPLPLDPAAELAACLQGRTTYCLRLAPWLPARLTNRDRFHIAAGRCTHTVVADHQCRPRTEAPVTDPPAPDSLF